MIYLVFALVLTAALLYLFLPARAVENVEQPSPAVGEQRAALRRQLAELEYEFSLGRINKQDFDRQQAELLVAWVELEKKAQEPRQENCRQCGTLLLAGARFCHHCGTRVAQLAFLVLFFLDVSSLQALDIVVNIHNGTYGTPERSPLKVQLLQLAGSMQPISQTVAHNGRAQFRNIPESPDSPYMVQANYQNVNYSQVIPPLARSPVHVTLEVFASTDSTENLSVRPLVELRRVAADRLSGLLILFFRNSGKRTYFSKDGIIFSLPATATFEQVSVSVGSGKSDIQWLKVAAEATD
ncbi:MAG: hypothetical protein N2Z22_05970, partial [Turneriella sp.]|nr:hypothetical protein [Turneriella sp.]